MTLHVSGACFVVFVLVAGLGSMTMADGLSREPYFEIDYVERRAEKHATVAM